MDVMRSLLCSTAWNSAAVRRFLSGLNLSSGAKKIRSGYGMKHNDDVQRDVGPTFPAAIGSVRIGRRTFCLFASGCAIQRAVCGKIGNHKRSSNMEVKRAGSQPSAKG